MAVVRDALGEGRVPAPVLQMAVLAGAGIEQRPEPVGGIGRSRRRDPVLAEDGVTDLEVELALEVHVAGGGGEGVGVGHARLRGGAAAGLVLALLGLGEIGGRRREAGDARIGARAMALPGAEEPAAGSRQAQSARQASAYAARLASAMLRTVLGQRDSGTWNGFGAIGLRQNLTSSKTHGRTCPKYSRIFHGPAVFVRHIAAGPPDVLEVRLQRPARGKLHGVADLEQRLVIARHGSP